MSVRAFLDNLHRRGVRLRLNGDRVRWFAPVGVVTDADLAKLRDHKTMVIALLRDAEVDAIEERAAIMEYDAGLPRAEAERLALIDVTGGAA